MNPNQGCDRKAYHPVSLQPNYLRVNYGLRGGQRQWWKCRLSAYGPDSIQLLIDDTIRKF